jgi:hypothetical protein
MPSKIMQGLLMCSLLVSAAAASLDQDIRANNTYIQLQPGTHAFSGANVSGSLTIVGASAGDTTVECSGAFVVMGALALHNLTITGCENCQLDAAIHTSSGHLSLENVHLHQSSLSCGGTGSLWLRGVNITNVDISDNCRVSWKYGHADGQLKIAGMNP